MSRSVLILSLLLAYLVPAAQSTLDGIKNVAGKDQLWKAKQQLDQYLTVEANANDAEAWKLRSQILYMMITAKQPEVSAFEAHREAFDSYKKYLTLTQKADSGGHEILYAVLFSNIDRANHFFQHKKFPESLKAFLDVEEMEGFIVNGKWRYQDFTFPVFDTQLYVNIGAAAIGAKRDELALQYYRRVADVKISGKGYDGIYRWLADKYDRTGDRANRNRYMQIGRELYPTDPFWCQIMLREAGHDRKKLLSLYEELVGDSCNNYHTLYNYAAELYNYSFRQTARPDDYAKMHVKIPKVLKNALVLKQTPEANLLMSRYELALANDLVNTYNNMKTDSPEKTRKKEGIAAQINEHFDQVQLYAGNVYDLLDSKTHKDQAEKDSYRTACKMLADYWERKNDKVRGKEFRDKANGIK